MLVLIYFFGGQFGVGIGEGDGDGSSPVSVNSSGKELQNVSTPNNEKTDTDWYRDGVVVLRTLKDGYEVDTSKTKGTSTYVSIEIEKLKQIIAEAPGNNQKIKVRVHIDSSSTPKIEDQLEKILREMNLVKDRDYLFVK